MLIEEADLADMLSDAGVQVTWGSVTRQGLYRRQTEDLVQGVVDPVREEVPSVLVELSWFRGIQEDEPITVDTPDGSSWTVRFARVEMRSLLRIYLRAEA